MWKVLLVKSLNLFRGGGRNGSHIPGAPNSPPLKGIAFVKDSAGVCVFVCEVIKPPSGRTFIAERHRENIS